MAEIQEGCRKAVEVAGGQFFPVSNDPELWIVMFQNVPVGIVAMQGGSVLPTQLVVDITNLLHAGPNEREQIGMTKLTFDRWSPDEGDFDEDGPSIRIVIDPDPE